MACPTVHTGGRFLAEVLANVDCQAQSIGAYGFGALSAPGSAASLAITGLLTIFVALFAIRLILGEQMGARDVVLDVLKVGIVITLATSWPAWRVLGYNTVLTAPAALAGTIGFASGLPGATNELTGRLQAADDSIVILTIYGTGRLTGGTSRSDSINDSFRGVALADQTALGYGRVAFLGGIIGPTAAVRLGAGILLAIAPLMAGLLLFAGTSGLFFGWLRALAACAAGALVLPLIYGVELSIIEPWLREAVAQRGAQVLTPSTPTELIVIGLSFFIAAVGALAVIGRLAFFGGPVLHRLVPALGSLVHGAQGHAARSPSPMVIPGTAGAPSRAYATAEAVAHTMRREEGGWRGSAAPGAADPARQTAAPAAGGAADRGVPRELLGDTYRSARRSTQTTGASERRDLKA